jgi:superfamily I DNA/RNA helicase
LQLALNQSLYNTALEIVGQSILAASDQKKLSQLMVHLEQLVKKIIYLADVDSLKEALTKLDLLQLVELVVKQFVLKKTPQLIAFKSNLVRFSDQDNQLEHFIKYLAQIADQDYYDNQADKISFLTMHSAKGLEFSYVYLIGFEKGYLPLAISNKQKTASALGKKEQRFTQSTNNSGCLDQVFFDPRPSLKEEKRLFFVALTRAKKGLYILKTKKRFQKNTHSSVFEKMLCGKIKQLTDAKLTSIVKKIKRKKRADRQASLF